MNTANTSKKTPPWPGDSSRSRSIRPAPTDTVEILKGLRDRYEAHHRVQILDSALAAAVELSDRYITGRCLPDKAIDVLDEAGARIRLRSMTKPPNLAEIEEQIERLSIQKDEAVRNAEYEEAAKLRDTAEGLRAKKEEMQRQWREAPRKWTASSMKKSSPRSSAR